MTIGVAARVLGHPVALQIVNHLTKHSEYSAKTLASELALPLEVVTFQLLSLEAQGLVKGQLREVPGTAVTLAGSQKEQVERVYAVTPKVTEVVRELQKIVSR